MFSCLLDNINFKSLTLFLKCSVEAIIWRTCSQLPSIEYNLCLSGKWLLIKLRSFQQSWIESNSFARKISESTILRFAWFSFPFFFFVPFLAQFYSHVLMTGLLVIECWGVLGLRLFPLIEESCQSKVSLTARWFASCWLNQEKSSLSKIHFLLWSSS